MPKTLDNLLPKLVLAPAFVLGLAFIYGFMVWNGLLSVTASRMLPNYEWVGLAQYSQAETVTDLIQRADKALYQAKAEGRDRLVVAPA